MPRDKPLRALKSKAARVRSTRDKKSLARADQSMLLRVRSCTAHSWEGPFLCELSRGTAGPALGPEALRSHAGIRPRRIWVKESIQSGREVGIRDPKVAPGLPRGA